MEKNILVNINSSYKKYMLVMLKSLALSNPDSNFRVFIMHNDLSDKDKTEIEINLDKNVKVSYILLDNAVFKGAPTVKKYPYEIYYRLFAPELLPKNIDRVLYLDSDIIIHKNIDDLYNMEFGNCLLIGSTQVRWLMQWLNRIRLCCGCHHVYMNTGVMLMNLPALRELFDKEKIFSYIKKNKWRMILYDQDVSYKFYGNRVKIISSQIYNLADPYIPLYNNQHRKEKIDLDWVEKNNVIIHYLGTNKPWKKNYTGILKPYYDKYEKLIKKI